ncbi:MAG: DNA-protecting protein DprA, partial [Phycisphaeraceae bacterium]|nr:DNA-protecting protein DprA [Phycisphaeraceae bacterium]
CSAYGREQAGRFATYAAGAGLCVVSGGAYGIDAASHRAALRAGGRTLCVLGSGLGEPYPKEHIELFEQIVQEDRGAVISELAPTVGPRREHFPRRNRIVSGLSLGVLVVEAAARSGALITARLAAEEHHREVMALPGRADAATSAGCHRAIREGWAALVSRGEHLLEELGEAGQMLKAETEKSDEAGLSSAEIKSAGLTASQQKILAALEAPLAVDELAAATGLPVAKISGDLTVLEIRSLVRRGAGRIERTG